MFNNTKSVYQEYLQWLAPTWNEFNSKTHNAITWQLFKQEQAKWLSKLRLAYFEDTNHINSKEKCDSLSLEQFDRICSQ